MDIHEDVVMAGVGGDAATENSQDPDGMDGAHITVTQIEALMDDATDPGQPRSGSERASPASPRVSSLSLPVQPSPRVVDEVEEDGFPSPHSSSVNGTRIASQKLSMVEVFSQPATKTLPYASQRTGLVYDSRMRFHTELEIDEDEEIHPEDPRRIYEIYKDLVEAGLVEVEGDGTDHKLKPFKLIQIPARFAEAGEICLVHSRRHYEWMTRLSEMSKQELIALGKGEDSLYLHNLTFKCAKLSAGGAIEACRAVAAGRVRNAMAVIRPPGHHAEHDKAAGFCFFDNVAIAARVCQRDLGESCRRIFILDWDVHHGNGVQMAFENDPNVLYISLHVHNGGKFYPSGNYGDHLHVGIGPGVGRNINIPWVSNGMTDGDYVYAFQQIVMPCALEFDPDLVIISAGFDAAEGDMLGGCHVSPAGFAHMTHMLMTLACGKVVACLEGGYNLRAIARSALAVTRTLMGEPPDRLPGNSEPSRSCIDTVDLVRHTHAEYWKCLYPKGKAEGRLKAMEAERLHDALRRLQAADYSNAFGMVPLWITREDLSRSFDHQVLATDGYTDAKPLLVVFHDAPETIGEQNAHIGGLDPHKIIVTDVLRQYMKWAYEQKLSIIDVNMPKFLTSGEIDGSCDDSDSVELRLKSMRDCATYLWENHVEPYEATQIFLMGVGDGAAAVTHLLSHADDIGKRVCWTFNFTCEHDLRSVQRAGDDFFADWYYKHSDCFVARDHQAWNPDRTRRVRRKYGNLRRSAFNDLNEILHEAKEEVFEKLVELTANWREEENQRSAGRASVIFGSPQSGIRADSRPPPPAAASGLPQSQTQDFGELGGPLSATTPPAPVVSQPEVAVRSSPGDSPMKDVLRSPMGRLPPMGLFSTSPERAQGSKSPMVFGSPSGRVQ